MPKLKSKPKPERKPRRAPQPLWEGPESDADNGGLTQSLLSRWLCCRERFRLLAVEGLTTADQFNHRIEYGSMWHECEEAHARGEPVGNRLLAYVQGLLQRYPLAQEQIEHWYHVCRTQFPIYVRYWSKHPDVKDRKPMMQEEVFHIPYQLPSGRTVYLRGKWDSVDVVGSGNKQRIVLQENKTKGEVVEEQLRKQLLFDLQSMYYLVALRAAGYKCEAIRYNVVRRPLSGGKGSIRQYKPTKSNPQGESKQEFYDRLAKIIAEEPEHFFMRWDVIVTYKDVCQFCNWFLDPCLEELCRWWDYIRAKPLNPWRNGNTLHWQYPYGIYNALAQGGSTEVDEYLATGSMLGLAKIDSLFRELTDVS